MFRITCMVEDKHLADVLHAIVGKVLQMEAPTPVANAVFKNGSVSAQTGGRLVEMFALHLKRNKPSHVDTAFAKSFLSSVGRSPSSAGYLLKHAIDAALIKKSKGEGPKATYVVAEAQHG